MIFEIAPKNDKTELCFTHEGLMPDKECYEMCEKGWDIVVGNWLQHLITTGKPSEEMTEAQQIRKQHLESTENKSFTATIEVEKSAKEAFNGICKVNEWWGHIEGKTEKVNDVFTYRPNDTWVNFKITACSDKKIVWHITDCYLHFQNNKTEWTDTDVVFEIEKLNYPFNDRRS